MSRQIDFSKFESNIPKVMEDFFEYYRENFKSASGIQEKDFKFLPFEMQLGVFLSYMQENGIDVETLNADLEDFCDAVREALLEHESVLNHYS